MVVPLAARCVAAAVGVLLVVTSASSVIGTLIVPRSVASTLTKHVDKLVNAVFVLITKPVRNFHRRDRILATQSATLLLCQIIAWLSMFFVGYALIFWPLVHGGITDAFRTPDLASGRSADDGQGRIPAGHPRRRGAERAHHRDAADRLPAHSVLGVQPARERRSATQRQGGLPELGA